MCIYSITERFRLEGTWRSSLVQPLLRPSLVLGQGAQGLCHSSPESPRMEIPQLSVCSIVWPSSWGILFVRLNWNVPYSNMRHLSSFHWPRLRRVLLHLLRDHPLGSLEWQLVPPLSFFFRKNRALAASSHTQYMHQCKYLNSAIWTHCRSWQS